MTEQEAIWLSEYLKCWDATEAARLAEYKWPNKQGPAKKKKFAAEIKAVVDEKLMSADEAMYRFSMMARGDLADFSDAIKDGKLEKSNKSFLIKKLKTTKRLLQDGSTVTSTEIEIYNAQDALDRILKINDKAQDQPQKVVNYTADEWRLEVERRRQEAADTMTQFEDAQD